MLLSVVAHAITMGVGSKQTTKHAHICTRMDNLRGPLRPRPPPFRALGLTRPSFSPSPLRFADRWCCPFDGETLKSL